MVLRTLACQQSSSKILPAQRKATAQADTLGVANEPSRKRAMAEHGKLESAQDAGGGRLVDVTPLSELGQAVKAPPVEPAHATTADWSERGLSKACA